MKDYYQDRVIRSLKENPLTAYLENWIVLQKEKARIQEAEEAEIKDDDLNDYFFKDAMDKAYTQLSSRELKIVKFITIR